MELAHADHDSVLAAFLEPGELPDIAKRVEICTEAPHAIAP